VVQKVDKITVKLTNGKEYTAKLIGSDPNSDIALIKIDGAKGLKTAHLGDSDKIEVGDLSLAIGNPFGLQSTLTTGIISSKGQDVNSADGVSRIQTDASINPGNSGGPLLNVRGEVIGINQMIYSQSGGSVGIGFAIPINHAKHVIEKLKAGKKIRQGYIGVSVDPEAD
jgi:serine protease Do